MIPYGRQYIDDDDIDVVCKALRSDWLTCGPLVTEFESAVAAYVGANHAIALCNGTAALHSIMFAIGIGPGDEVIVPPITFAATANAVVYQGGTPVFADVCEDTLLMDPADLEARVSSRTKAVVAVDYAGHPCDYTAIREVCDRHGLVFVADSCHAIGASFKNKNVGSIADISAFSFHPVKHITTGEGGMITTNDEHYAQRARTFRHHGISTDFRQREKEVSFQYDIPELGYNYRITDIQCALGLSQLKKLDAGIARRNDIADKYNDAFAKIAGLTPLSVAENVRHAYHLYVVRLTGETRISRDELFVHLRNKGIGVNVHYPPVHLFTYYKKNFEYGRGMCPVAEKAFEDIISLPMYPQLNDEDLQYTIDTFIAALK
ncbi:UDP-4-amino-4,6-dideoxy-N-acetyl-beta-L-altrosamine transaminase [Salidesulfovibrio brasiliensis]|uniref:UDP-4-amino-4, 6-dideoxy-N-acetyl-beta-L-altrosamine transaminase n=1 Tax=Salidesulfovibrio brasiliensis TaxID=221711 RepID=UPI0006D08E99|nr:UDP-4-amino-4,6-dideoxy-N-acetyl-beta-L-altrosamine transaminase [Salidesulfovibrio brasiliensis]